MVVGHDTLSFDTTTVTTEFFFNARYNYRLEACVFHDSVAHIDSSYLAVNALQFDAASLQLHPNPATSEFTISCNVPFSEGSIASLYDVTGKLITTYAVTGNDVSLQLRNITSGLYLCKITNGNDLYAIKKLVVAR